MKENSERVNKEIEIETFHPRMKPNRPDKLNLRRTAFISFSFFTVLLAWSYFNFKIPLILREELIPASVVNRETIIGTIMALDNILAVFLQPFFGNLSDRTKSKFGRRMPYIIIGTLSGAFLFSVIPWMKVLSAFVAVIFLFDLAMSIYRSPSLAILPDYTPDSVRSNGSAIQQFIANMGGIIGFAIPIITGLFLAQLSSDLGRAIGFFMVSFFMIAFLVIQLFMVKETPTGKKFFELSPKSIPINPITFEIEKEIQNKIKKAKRGQGYRDIINLFKEKRNSSNYLKKN